VRTIPPKKLPALNPPEDGGGGAGASVVVGAGASVVVGAGASVVVGAGASVVVGAGASVVVGAGASVVVGAGASVVVGAGASVVVGAGASVVVGAGASVVVGAGASVVVGAGESVVVGACLSDVVRAGLSVVVVRGDLVELESSVVTNECLGSAFALVPNGVSVFMFSESDSKSALLGISVEISSIDTSSIGNFEESRPLSLSNGRPEDSTRSSKTKIAQIIQSFAIINKV